METFLLGLLFGVAIGVWISVAIIEWRLPEKKPTSMTQLAPAPPARQSEGAAPVSAPVSKPPSSSPATPGPSTAPPSSSQTGPTVWTPAMPASSASAPPPEARPSTATLSPEAQRLYSQLLNMAQGDRAKADRLIEYERSKSPAASTETLIGNAIDRWLHDHR
jgi:cytoskeletal protein RodZ